MNVYPIKIAHIQEYIADGSKDITGVFRKYVVFLNKKAHLSISHESSKVGNPSRNGENI
jgi:hypothetical protein